MVRAAPPLTLVGDGIENPWNAQTMIAAAAMFGGPCLFRDRAHLAAAWAAHTDTEAATCEPLTTTTLADLKRDYVPIVACENRVGATDIYGVRRPPGARPALVVGNERHGLAHDMEAIAHQVVQIPMAARTLNCLNVAAAAAVALYYLWRESGPLQQSAHPHRRRPEVLLVSPLRHVELGSTIRSAGAFGWDRLFVEDRAAVWFGVDRITRAEGRGAARRARNPIRVIPTQADSHFAFREASIITQAGDGVPLHRARLAGGPQHLIVIPDEEATMGRREDWSRLAPRVNHVRVDVPGHGYAYHYRLVATLRWRKWHARWDNGLQALVVAPAFIEPSTNARLSSSPRSRARRSSLRIWRRIEAAPRPQGLPPVRCTPQASGYLGGACVRAHRSLRTRDHVRDWMHARFREELVCRGLPFVLLQGSPDERLAAASPPIDALLAPSASLTGTAGENA